MDKIYRFKNRFYRYNYEKQLLEVICPEENVAIFSTELNKDKWEEDKMGRIEEYYKETEQKFADMKIYRFKNRFYRYNSINQVLELFWPEENMVVDSIGLSKDNWKEDGMYWIEKYHNELNAELASMTI